MFWVLFNKWSQFIYYPYKKGSALKANPLYINIYYCPVMDILL